MFRKIAHRLLWAIPTLWAIGSISFFIIRLAPGGPFERERALDPLVIASLEREYGIAPAPPMPPGAGLGARAANQTKHLARQYLRYMGGLCRGDMGPSLYYPGLKVSEILLNSLRTSFVLGAAALSIAFLFGIVAGTLAAWKRDTALDHGARAFAVAGISLPNFVIGEMFLLVFGLWLKVLPAGGWGRPACLILPALTLALPLSAYIARIYRASLIEVLGQDYIRTARAMGTGWFRVLFGMAVRNAILPVISFMGPAAAAVVTGSVVVERLFAIPGMGTHFVNGALNRDYTLVLGAVMVYGALLILCNILVDVAYTLIDPRIRL
ncbi:MAG TPA: ABC transporter permease [Candidatus Brocadiia bacterium]|nr:ABC transporter permease [Candidatus Brocadiia bacterium]